MCGAVAYDTGLEKMQASTGAPRGRERGLRKEGRRTGRRPGWAHLLASCCLEARLGGEGEHRPTPTDALRLCRWLVKNNGGQLLARSLAETLYG